MECIGNGRAARNRAFGIAHGIALALATCLAACSDGTPSRTAAPVTPTLAKTGGTGPSVQSTSPAYSHRDTTLDVHVLGSGFAAGAKAAWSLGGDTTIVRVNRTTYIS